ncbi:MAG TPA: alkaline phosphatase, partial [Flavobacteriales bacterium]|nr:alkaline phosphatase [Flavobacteriales bacterium]
PGWIDYSRTGTTHGSAFPQDTHVPALFLGSGIAHGETYKRTCIRDIAPTMAQIMRSPYPNGTTGKPIAEAIQP